MLECVLFDLDCTLHRMDQREFVKEYLGAIGKYMSKYGYEPKRLGKSILSSTDAAIAADGTRLNSEVFWSSFGECYGGAIDDMTKAQFDAFYNEVFDTLRVFCAPVPGAADAVRYIKSLGLGTVLASNPVFPVTAQLKRAAWAGSNKDDFDLVTSIENMHYCKPNPLYYTEIADMLGVEPQNCLMVGNDVREDMFAAEKAGMNVFLLPEFMINTDGLDASAYRQGSFSDLTVYIDGEMRVNKNKLGIIPRGKP